MKKDLLRTTALSGAIGGWILAATAPKRDVLGTKNLKRGIGGRR